MPDVLKSKKGFTLVELCIVIAIIGIVVSMALIFIAQYNKDTYSLMKNRNAMNDINTVRSMTNEWLLYYDNGKYTISPADAVNGSTVLQAKDASGKIDTLEINNGALVWKKNNAEYKRSSFESVTTAKFTFTTNNTNGEKPVIKCRVSFNDNRNWQDLIFSVMTKTPRSRYSPAES